MWCQPVLEVGLGFLFMVLQTQLGHHHLLKHSGCLYHPLEIPLGPPGWTPLVQQTGSHPLGLGNDEWCSHPKFWILMVVAGFCEGL